MSQPAYRLPELFMEIWKKYNAVDKSNEPTNSDKIQGTVRVACEMCKKAILMVNELDVFSKNEDIDEVSTNEVKYLLLPALMAYFLMQTTIRERLKVVTEAQDYYKDFMRLCKTYGLTTVDVYSGSGESEASGNEVGVARRQPGAPNLQRMAGDRQSKIQRYKEQQALEGRIADLQVKVEQEHVDDEVKRDYYLSLIKRWVNTTLDELDSIQTEIQILEMMAKRKEAEKTEKGGPQKPQEQKPPPLRPFILTKTQLQKEVFGLGYPSLPTMTIEEFYEQKAEAGTLPIPGQGHSMQDWAQDPEKDKEAREKEESEKEEKIEKEDADTLRAAREWDDWKDDHRRGWGNRQNMG